MNPETLELIASLALLGEKVYLQMASVLSATKNGTPLPPDQLKQMKLDSDAAHATIQSWAPPQPQP